MIVDRLFQLLLAAALLGFAAPHQILAATVQTLDGATLEGDFKLTPEGLVITPRGKAAPQRIAIADILHADLRKTPATRPAGAVAGVKPKWIARDIGQVRAFGSSRIAPGVGADGGIKAVVRGAGDTLGTADAFQFLYQPLSGDGTITVKLTSLAHSDRLAKAGVMIRTSTEPASAFVALVAHAGDRPMLLTRPRAGASVAMSGAAQADIPLFLRLTRQGNRFIAFASADGREWEEVADATVAMPAGALAGVAVASRLPNTLTTATFERLTLVQDVPADEAGAAGPLGRKLRQGVILRDGTRLAGRITAVTGSSVRLLRERELTIPITDIAQVQLQPRQASLSAEPPLATPGVLLINGDFFEGEFRGLEGGRATLSSILFGLQRIPEGQIRSVVLRPVAGADTAYEVHLAEGSILMSDAVTPQQDGLLVQLRGAGAVMAGGGEILDIRAGPARRTALRDLTPSLIAEGGDGLLDPLTTDATPSGAPLSLDGRAYEQGLGLSAGTRVGYDLPQGQRMFAFTAGVPDGMLPVASVRFIVRLAGREAYRSPLRTALDEPLEVRIPLNAATDLEIACEAAPGSKVPACGVIVDAHLVR